MKRIKSIAAAALAALIFLLPVSAADKYPKPTSQFFVNDFAEVIEQSAEDEI